MSYGRGGRGAGHGIDLVRTIMTAEAKRRALGGGNGGNARPTGGGRFAGLRGKRSQGPMQGLQTPPPSPFASGNQPQPGPQNGPGNALPGPRGSVGIGY